MTFRVSGIDLGLNFPSRQVVGGERVPPEIALLGGDYRNLRPRLAVEEGQAVRGGDVVFTDRRHPGLAYVAPAGGTVKEIRLGGRRSLDRIVISLDEREGRAFDVPQVLSRESLTALLVDSGAWHALKTRPYDDTPVPGSVPDALFVTAIDTRPLAPDPALVVDRYPEWFRRGLEALRLLTDGPVYLCHAAGVSLPAADDVRSAAFSGPHPAGLPGTHIHRLHPVGGSRSVWHIGYQDVIAAGHLLEKGFIWTRRVIALAGTGIAAPTLIETVPGANLAALCDGLTIDAPVRILSGSPLDGRHQPFLGRGDLQVTALARSKTRTSGPDSVLSRVRAWLSTGGHAIIPNAAHERAAPAGILPIPFLRAISVGDAETARKLGALGLAEEDMALLTYVDGGHNDFGALLRRTLDELKEAQ